MTLFKENGLSLIACKVGVSIEHTIRLDQWLSTWGDVTRGYLAATGDIFDDHNSWVVLLASSGWRAEMLLNV